MAENNHDLSPVVNSPQGPVQGITKETTKGKPFFAFLGVPYAKPPIGKLRFEPPQPTDTWTETYNATKEGSPCLHFDMMFAKSFVGSEDCLVLNVFTREIATERSRPKRDVMVWIHGGGFVLGSSSTQWYGPEILLNKDIVLVTVNYRLGIFGFLSTGDDVCPGNNGLRDQVMALRWVKENISAYGGNPDSVTIFGESAGGASVHFHLLSPMSKGLFHRAIAQSGTAVCPWAIDKQARQRARKLAELLECPTHPSTALLDALKQKSAQEIIEQYPKFLADDVFLAKFCPVVESIGDEPFLPQQPITMLINGDFHPVPVIFGFNSDEGAMFAAPIVSSEELTATWNSSWEEMAAKNLVCYKKDMTKVKNFYLDRQGISLEKYHGLSNALGDRHFVQPILKTVGLQASHRKAPTFLYQLVHRGKFCAVETMYKNEDLNYGVTHLDELQYLFSGVTKALGYTSSETDDAQEVLSDIMVDMWTNFARTGRPTPPGTTKGFGFKWESVKPDNSCFLKLQISPEMAKHEDLPWKRMNFWNDVELDEQKLTV